MDWIVDPQIWIAFLTLTTLEVVLGIDNVIFISILSGKLPAAQQSTARTVGLSLAMIMRIALLFSITWVMRLTEPWFVVWGQEISGRDAILLLGGLFLLGKATVEIHESLEGQGPGKSGVVPSLGSAITQIVILDIVFSLDSVITAVGMTNNIGVMVSAVVVAVIFMLAFARSLGEFVQRHPTIKMLALSFLLLIGVSLIAEGLDQHISKGYIYFAMGFSVFVEMLNLRLRKRGVEPVQLRTPTLQD
ncbi:MAG: TerC family protein [Bacteroidota bacterium]